MFERNTVVLATALIFAASLCAQAPTPQQAPRGARAWTGGRRAQAPPPPQGREDALDPSPINPATDPNIDMFIGDWRSSRPRTLYGHLVFHDILTPLEGPDKIHPSKRGAVLEDVGGISYATLQPGAIATGRVQSGQRQTFYTSAGTGEITVNSKSYDVKEGVGFVLRPNVDFKLTSKGKEPLRSLSESIRSCRIIRPTPSSASRIVSPRTEGSASIGLISAAEVFSPLRRIRSRSLTAITTKKSGLW